MHTRQQHTAQLNQLRRELENSVRRARRKTTPADLVTANMWQLFSANVHHLLPAISMREHAVIFHDVLLHQAQAEFEDDTYFLLEQADIDDRYGALENARLHPVIFATFHYGSYRLANMLLVSKHVNFVLPVESHHYVDKQQYYMDRSRECNAYFNSQSQFMLVNAEEPVSALTMARKAKAGWSLLGYLDGNTGVQGGQRQDSKLLRVFLLGKPIYARKGIPFLAHFLKLPIVPVFCEIKDDSKRHIILHEPIVPESGSERDTFCLAATQTLYTLLGEYIQRDPTQWLGWLDMHKYLDLDVVTPATAARMENMAAYAASGEVGVEKLVFNHERFGFIVTESERVLLDKTTYELLTVPDSVCAVLDTCQEPLVVTSAMSAEYKEVIEYLLSLKLLVPAAKG